MSLNIREIILHVIQQDIDNPDNPLTTNLREQSLELSPQSEQMMMDLHTDFENKSKSYAVFTEISEFQLKLKAFLEGEIQFIAFSQFAAQRLATELSKYPFASGGTLVVCQYQFLATDYLLISLLENRWSVLVDGKLNLRSDYALDIHSNIVARINLTELSLDPQSNRYLTFIKGRVGRKVADFFMDFLAAEEGLNPQMQNQALLQAVNDYCEQGELNKSQTHAVKKQVYDFCNCQLSNNEDVKLDELSASMPTLNKVDFATFAQQQDYGLDDSIPPVRATLKALTKFSGSGKGVSLTFNAELLGERVIWDEHNDSLLIKGLPANLRDQLQRNSGE